MVKLVDSTPWVPLIGRLFVALGGIERTTHECIREWAGATIHKHFGRAPLSARLDLAADLAKSQRAADSTKEAFVASIAKARGLLKHRNLVAHSPLCLVLLQGELDSSFLEAIASNTSDNHMTLKDLDRVVEEAERCEEELVHNYVAFKVEELDLEAVNGRSALGGLRPLR